MLVDRDFFERPTLEVAHDLLGKYLLRRIDGETDARMICEVEAYDGFEDRASHAHRGATKRNQVMFGPAGVWYVYLCYGVHDMLNIVTGAAGYPAAILLRGVADVSGPGRLTRALGVNRDLNGREAIPASGLWIEDRGFAPPPTRIRRTPRIGVDYAGEWAKADYRFILEK